MSAANLRAMLDDLARRMALAIMRPEVVVLRRLLVGEARAFPTLSAEYFDRAPAQVLDALAAGFERLARIGLLRISDTRLAAAQFAYLIVGEPLDRAMLVGTVAPKAHVVMCAREGVQTFLARYEASAAVDSGPRSDPYNLLVYTSFQERATRISHNNVGRMAGHVSAAQPPKRGCSIRHSAAADAIVRWQVPWKSENASWTRLRSST